MSQPWTVISARSVVRSIWDGMWRSILKTEGLHLGLVVDWFIHQYVLNGYCVPGIGLSPGTLWWAKRQSPPLHGVRSQRGGRGRGGQWVSVCSFPPSLAGPPDLTSPPHHLAHCPKQTPKLQPV